MSDDELKTFNTDATNSRIRKDVIVKLEKKKNKNKSKKSGSKKSGSFDKLFKAQGERIIFASIILVLLGFIGHLSSSQSEIKLLYNNLQEEHTQAKVDANNEIDNIEKRNIGLNGTVNAKSVEVRSLEGRISQLENRLRESEQEARILKQLSTSSRRYKSEQAMKTSARRSQYPSIVNRTTNALKKHNAKLGTKALNDYYKKYPKRSPSSSRSSTSNQRFGGAGKSYQNKVMRDLEE